MMLRIFATLAFIILKVAYSTQVLAVTNDCPGDVYVDGAVLVVEPTGINDTENLQCAVDSASRQSLKAVRLEAGDYYIDQLLISNFEGSIEGKSIGTTRLRLSRRQLDCPKEDFESIAAPIMVEGGDTVFRYMTVDASAGPCFRGDSWSAFLYTQQSCSSRVVFGAVDRVRVIGDGSSGSVGIAAVSQPACAAVGNGALGTFRVNRVALESLGVGVRTSKVGVAQVDINFSDFTQVGTGIQIFNANQSTSIVSNRIEYNAGPTNGKPMGIFVDTTEAWAPEENRTVIHQNTLAQGTFDDSSRAVVLSNSTIEADHSAVITRNVFQLKSNSRSANNGVVITDTDNVTIVDNRFLGSANYSIYVDSPTWFQNRRNTEGTVINRNDFTDIVPRTAADIFLGGGTSLSLVGPQAATIKDSGADNFIAESTAQADAQEPPGGAPGFSPSGDSSGSFDDGDSTGSSGFGLQDGATGAELESEFGGEVEEVMNGDGASSGSSFDCYTLDNGSQFCVGIYSPTDQADDEGSVSGEGEGAADQDAASDDHSDCPDSFLFPGVKNCDASTNEDGQNSDTDGGDQPDSQECTQTPYGERCSS